MGPAGGAGSGKTRGLPGKGTALLKPRAEGVGKARELMAPSHVPASGLTSITCDLTGSSHTLWGGDEGNPIFRESK